MNRIDDSNFNLKGNNESFNYLGSVSPEEEARLAEQRKKKSKKRTRLIAGLVAGGTLIGGITASYLKNNALISPYTSDIGQELFNTPEYKEIYKEYRNTNVGELDWNKGSNSAIGYYTKQWGFTEEEAINYTVVKDIYFTKNKLFVISVMIRGVKSDLPIYTLLEYEVSEDVVKDLITLKEQGNDIQLNLLMQYISKTIDGKVISQFYQGVPSVLLDREYESVSADCMYNFDDGYLSGYAFVKGENKIYNVYNYKTDILKKDDLGVYPNSMGSMPFCQVGGEVADIIDWYSNTIIIEQRARDLGFENPFN